uniref:Uncharacterized protein n=1 Tax=Rangifer tarandus platyrhynchus TaxID=3082113 RepID=A0ACB0EUJ8_RANTA|nr:unnamed protein product [Rangifer tarandus platyrhynchus]
MPPVRTRSALLAFLPPALTPTCAPPQDPVLSQPPVTLIVPWSSPPPQPLSLLQARYHTRRQSTLAATEAGAAPLWKPNPLKLQAFHEISLLLESALSRPCEDNRKVLVPLPQVPKTWKEMTRTEVRSSDSYQTQLSWRLSRVQRSSDEHGVAPSSAQTVQRRRERQETAGGEHPGHGRAGGAGGAADPFLSSAHPSACPPRRPLLAEAWALLSTSREPRFTSPFPPKSRSREQTSCS